MKRSIESMINPIASAACWTRQQLEADASWIQPLKPPAADDLRRALDYALSTGKSLLQMSRSDFPLAQHGRRALADAVATTQSGCGIALMRGLPVDELSEADVRTLCWGIGLNLGVARPQGKKSQFMSDVRAEGGQYRSPTGRGYNTNSALDFHSDACDVVALLCIRTAKSGGESLASSAVAAHNEMLRARPDLLEILYQPFVYSRQGEEAPEEPPYFEMPIFGQRDGRFACRHVRNHIRGAQESFAEIPRLTPLQLAALDCLDVTLAREDFCFRMNLEQGDVQFMNNHVVLHSRTGCCITMRLKSDDICSGCGWRSPTGNLCLTPGSPSIRMLKAMPCVEAIEDRESLLRWRLTNSASRESTRWQ